MKERVNLDLLVDQCLERMAAGATVEECLAMHPLWRAELEPLLRTAAALRHLPVIEPEPDVVERIWGRLEAEMASESIPAVTKGSFRRSVRQKRTTDWSRARRQNMSGIAAAVALVVALMGGGGMVYASQDSMPGQALYQVKGILEATRLRLSTSEQARMELRVGFAEEKLHEAATLADSDGGVGLSTALQAYSRHLSGAEAIANQFGDPQDDSRIQAEVEARLRLQIQELQRIRLLIEEDDTPDDQAEEALDEAEELSNRLRESLEQRLRERQESQVGSGEEQTEQDAEEADDETPAPQQGVGPSATPSSEPLRQRQEEQDQNRNREVQATSTPEEIADVPTDTPKPDDSQTASDAVTSTPAQEQSREQHQEQNREPAATAAPAAEPTQVQIQDRDRDQDQSHTQDKDQDQVRDQDQTHTQDQDQDQSHTQDQDQDQDHAQDQSQDGGSKQREGGASGGGSGH